MRQDFPRIFLCGFMGSGKSTLGKALAKQLGYGFVDLDVLIEQKSGKSIPRIFKEDGESGFRRLEQEVLTEVCGQKERFVCALGGGSICSDQALQEVKNCGLLLYLRLPAAALANRLKKHGNARPMLDRAEHKSLEEHINDLLEKRLPFYEQAHLSVQGIDLTAASLLEKIREIR